MKTFILIFLSFLSFNLFPSDLPTLKIEIPKKDFNEISKIVKRNQKYKVFLEKKWFKGIALLDGKKVPLSIRLKGDQTDHISENRKWSFRIRLKKENYFLGARKFSIQHPKTRNYLYEWLYSKVLMDEGFIVANYEFINLIINKTSWGIYSFEEYPSDELLERFQRRKGPIVKLNEKPFWNFNLLAEKKNRHNENVVIPELTAVSVKGPINGKKLKKENKSNLFSAAKEKWEGLINGKYSYGETFDNIQMAKFFALCDLFLAHHGCNSPLNYRFYYDPIRGLLEPIPADGMPNTPSSLYSIVDHYRKIKAENSMEFFDSYTYYLKKYSDDKFIKEFKTKYLNELQSLFLKLKAEYKEISADLNYLSNSAGNIRTLLEPIGPSESIKVTIAPDEKDTITLYFNNLRKFPLQIKGFYFRRNGKLEKIDPISTNLHQHKINKNYYLFPNIFPSKIIFKKKQEDDLLNLIAEFKGIQDKEYQVLKIRNIKEHNNPGPPKAPTNINTLSSSFPFIYFEKPNTIYIKSGNWQVLKDLVFPKGYEIIIEPNTNLQFSPGKVFLSYSPIFLYGLPHQPITLTSIRGFWGGLFVLNGENSSIIKNTIISNTEGANRPGWMASAGLTFYKSPFKIESISFDNSIAADSLSVISSDFEIKNCNFRQVSGDAIDLDFSNGKISDCEIEDAGGDGIDLSQSTLEISNSKVQNASDKGFSVGEKSTLYLSNSKVLGCKIGIASKGGSSVKIYNNSFSNNEVSLKAYTEKTYWKKGVIEGTSNSFSRNKIIFDKKSSKEISLNLNREFKF